MLYLTRKVGETVVINDDIRVTVVEVRGRSIKLGFTFPSNVSVLREELYERIQEENRAAALATVDSFNMFMEIGDVDFSDAMLGLGADTTPNDAAATDAALPDAVTEQPPKRPKLTLPRRKETTDAG